MKFYQTGKRFIAILCAVLLFSGLSFGCQKAEQHQKIWIFCDWNAEGPFQGTYRITEKEVFLNYISYLTELPKEDIVLEFLPLENSERSARLSALRTEIMAGGGPDVFFLSCSLPGWGAGFQKAATSFDVSSNYEIAERLFPDVQAAMGNKIFLPLDDRIKNASWLDISLLTPTLLNAGKTEEGQQVLPITVTFPITVYEQESGELKPSQKIEQHSLAVAAKQQFADLFGQLADYSQNNLLFSKKELLDTVKHNLMLDKQYLSDKADSDGFLTQYFLSYCDMGEWNYQDYDLQPEQKTGLQDFCPVQNTEGGVTAAVTAYAGVNRNTKHPESAFRIVEFLFRDDVQTALGRNTMISWGRCEDSLEETERELQTFLLAGCYGVPVRGDLMQDWKHSFCQRNLHDPNAAEMFSKYTALRNEVTHARFYGALDAELQAMYEACLEAKTDEEIEKIVSKAYDTMEMILAES
ncbi:hypothetical protein [uncultured Neglectibacter sp.]|uniref:hypothetical protein n=1 Tax=uncultured Neglectibacter sp. TaxID=1924108 RepID=UPI0034DF4E56